MPPKQRFTRDEIAQKALDIVREHGMAALTARSLASALSSSPKVIFGLFSGMDEVRAEVLIRARALYSGRMMEALGRTDVLPYRSCALCFVRFAYDEKELFRLLFMKDRKDLETGNHDDTLDPIHRAIMKGLGVDRKTAETMHSRYSIFAYGLACIAANSAEPADEKETDMLLSENWEDLVHRYRSKK